MIPVNRTEQNDAIQQPPQQPVPVVPVLPENFITRSNDVIERAVRFCLGLAVTVLTIVVPRKFQSGFRAFVGEGSNATRSLSQSATAKNMIMLVMLNGLIGVFGIATQILITNGLGRETFGEYAFYAALGAYGASLVRFGRDRTMIRDIVHCPERFEDIVGGTVILSLILATLFFIGLWICGTISGMSMPVALWLVVLGCILVSFDLQPIYDSWHRMGLHAVFALYQRVFEYAPLWIIILVCPWFFNIPVIALFTISASLLILSYQYRGVLAATHLRVFNRQNLIAAWHQFFANFEIALGTFLGLFFGPTTRVFLKHSWDSSEVGIFSATFQILLIVVFLFTQISRISRPAMARVTIPGVEQRKKRKVVFLYTLIMLAVSLPFAMPMIFFPKQITALVFIPEYSRVAEILPVLGVYKIVTATGSVLNQYIQAARYDRLYLFGIAAGAALCIVLGFTMIPAYGASGAAWTLLLSHGLLVFISLCVAIYSLYFQKQSASASS